MSWPFIPQPETHIITHCHCILNSTHTHTDTHTQTHRDRHTHAHADRVSHHGRLGSRYWVVGRKGSDMEGYTSLSHI